MRRKYMNEETDNVNVYESKIACMYRGLNNTMVIIIDWLEGDPIKVVCEDTSDVIVRLKHNPQYERNVIGVLEITGFSYMRTNVGYVVQFNFDHNLEGIIRVECKEFYFMVSSEPLSMGGNDNRI